MSKNVGNKVRNFEKRTKEQNAVMFERWRNHTLNRKDSAEAWYSAAFLVQSCVKYRQDGCGLATYKLNQSQTTGKLGGIPQDQLALLSDRVLMFHDFLVAYSHKTIPWCVVAFRRRFYEMDAVRELAALGFGGVGTRNGLPCRSLKLLRSLSKYTQDTSVEGLMEVWRELHPELNGTKHEDTTRRHLNTVAGRLRIAQADSALLEAPRVTGESVFSDVSHP